MENMFLNNNLDPDNSLNRLIKLGVVAHDPRMIVYKYRPIEWAKQMLEECVLRYSSSDSFTDELEFDFNHLDFSISETTMRRRLFETLERNKPQMDIVERVNFCTTTNVQKYKESYLQNLLKQKGNTPVLCTCKTFDDEYMWQEYGDKDKGVCIGFYIPPIIPEIDMLTMNVNYVDKITPVKVFGGDGLGSIDPDAILYWMFTKSSKFRVEQEIRSVLNNIEKDYFTSDRKFMEVQYYPDLFREIYFGANCSQQDIEDIDAILRNGHYDKIEKFCKLEYR